MFALELRLSDETDSLKWVLGSYYYNESQTSQFLADSGLLQHTGRVADVDTKAIAFFGQATYSFTNEIRIIGGLRYTSDRRELNSGSTFFLSPSFLGTSPANPLLPVGPGNPLIPNFFFGSGPNSALLIESSSGKKTFTNTSWKIGFEYDVAKDAMLFATASSGFKAGGFNTQQRVGISSGSNEASSFLPETLTSYDLGMKTQFFDNRLQLNAGLFYWDYRNQQIPLFSIGNAGNLDIIFDNAQKAHMYGGNIELVAKPWYGGIFNLSIENNNAKYDTFIFNTAQLLPGSTGCLSAPKIPIIIGPAGPVMEVDCSGKTVPRAPKWTGSIGYTHNIEVDNGGNVAFNANMTFASSREITADYIQASRVGGYALFNLSLEYVHPDDSFSITAFVRNLTNETLYNGGSQPNYAPGVVIGSIGMPRSYGVRLAVNL